MRRKYHERRPEADREKGVSDLRAASGSARRKTARGAKALRRSSEQSGEAGRVETGAAGERRSLRSQPRPPVREETEERGITAEDLSRIPKPEPLPSSSPEESAKVAQAAAEQQSDGRTPAAPVSDGKALVGLAELAVFASVDLAAARWGIKRGAKEEPEKPEDALERVRSLSLTERKLLELLAPGAESYFGPALALTTPKYAAWGFVGCLGLFVMLHLIELKRSLPPTKEHRDDLAEHRKTWGSAADAVKPGTRAMDVGFPPPFTPQGGG